MINGVFVTGIGTEIGKTVVSSVLVEAFGADYWKPVQSGDLDYTDSDKVKEWAEGAGVIHPETYRLHTPASPHASARMDQVAIELDRFQLPETDNFLIVEGAGGLWVPLSQNHSMLDLIQHLDLPVVMVSRHYLGSINHTLLSLEALEKRSIPCAALIWNGPATPDTEQIIEQFSGINALLRLEEMPLVSSDTVRGAAMAHLETLTAWKHELTGKG